MRMYLIRHGESVWNAQDRIQGHGDSPLSPRGLEQAMALGRRLREASIRAVYSSPLLRARQTAEAIRETLRAPLVLRSELREIHLGDWEGKTPDEVNARFDNGYDVWRTRPTAAVIPNAEPIEAFRQRAINAIEAVARTADAETVAIVTHGGVICAYLAHLLDADFDLLLRRLQINNSGVTIIEALEHEHPAILAVNDLRHLHNHHAAD